MSLGSKIRRAFGPFERPVTNLYRSIFVDLNSLIKIISLNSQPDSILEIGCGEGAVTEKLAETFPSANIVAIDISPSLGRQFQGNTRRVEFKQITVDDYLQSTDSKFDLVLICDVLHHVPIDEHEEILKTAIKLLSGSGTLILKEWEHRNNLINQFSYLMERYVTQDDVKYKTEEQWIDCLRIAYDKDIKFSQQRIRPWKNNIIFIVNS